ncbi:MAG: adenosine deaminase family protein, partial [Planctomycetota bacterium]
DNIAEGVRYIEVRFAPQLHQSRRLSILDVLKAVTKGLTLAKDEYNRLPKIHSKKEPPFAFGLIVCAMRMFEADYSEYFSTLINVHKHSDKTWVASLAAQELVKASIFARDKHACPVTGFDLAGMEKGYPAADFKASYDLAHKHFLNKTVHAGENYGPESIFQAITELHADRIGHGMYLFDTEMIKDRDIKDRKAYVENLVHYIGDRRITLEISLTSNMQTNPDIKRLSQHPFQKMRKAKLSATFCTDNRTVSDTSVTEELLKAVKTFKLTPKELKDYVIYGFKRSFYPGPYSEKRRYVRQVIDYYESMEKEAGIS